MIVLHDESEFRGNASVVALGMFDGVHIGHQELIRTAVKLARESDAQCVVCTFDRHPLSLICPERAPKPILTLEENLKKFERLGADAALVKRFDKAFADMCPEDYLELLVDRLKAKAIVIGENYTFGREGRGNAQMVKLLSTKFGYRACIVEPVMDGKKMASSTYVRQLLNAGERVHAERLLSIREPVGKAGIKDL